VAQDKLMVRFSRVKMDEGLSRILAGYDRIFIYSTDSGDNATTAGLTKVRIYSRFQVQGKKSKETALVIRPGAPLSLPVSTGHAEKASNNTPAISASLEKRSMIQLEDYSKALQDKNPNKRIDAVKTLGWVGDESVLPTLAQAWQDKDPRVKKEAEKALGDIGKDLKEKNRSEEQEEAKNPEDVMPPSEREASLYLSESGGGVVNLELDNGIPLGAVQFTVNGANLREVNTTPRSEGFFARYNEKNGTVVLVSMQGQKIAPGNGPIAEIVCDNPSAQITNIKMSK